MLIEAINIEHRFGSRAVLSGFSHAFSTGSIAIVGPSGSGKTTLLCILGGLLRPSSGELRVDGHAVSAKWSDRVAWVPQSPVASMRRTALENIVQGGLNRPSSRRVAIEDAASIAADLALNDVMRRPARLLSGGELQRVAIGRALNTRLPVICADEPTGQLDARTTRQVLDCMFTALRNHDRLVLIATHDEEVWKRCDSVIEISRQ
ncbi:MAG: ABC transporter ATP-binding protein [Actinomycetes bacterium]